MKYVKTLGLLAVATALMIFASPASAAFLTSNEGATPSIAATSGSIVLEGAFIPIKCAKSEIAVQIGVHGGTVAASGPVSTLHFSECNYPVTTDPATTGTLSIYGAATTGNGTLTSSGAEITAHTSVGTCVFTTSNTDLGTVTGSNITGGPAVLDITGKIPRTGGSFVCGSSGQLTANYTITKPSGLEVH